MGDNVEGELDEEEEDTGGETVSTASGVAVVENGAKVSGLGGALRVRTGGIGAVNLDGE